MALKTTIPTLEIKTSGMNLFLADTLFVTIKQGDFQTVKSNDDIEVDNDVISVSLSQDEAAQLSNGGGANISIMAVRYDGNISNVKIAWAKRGSRTDSAGSGGGAATSDMLWYPFVSSSGDLTWSKSETDMPPSPVNIKGAPGKNGDDGFSPTIVPNSGNTEDIYKLDVTTKTEKFTTPNLKGEKGEPGSSNLYAFSIRDDGCLWIKGENKQDLNRYRINEDGCLIVTM